MLTFFLQTTDNREKAVPICLSYDGRQQHDTYNGLTSLKIRLNLNFFAIFLPKNRIYIVLHKNWDLLYRAETSKMVYCVI